MDVIERINYFMKIKKIASVNELANRSLLTQSTVDNIIRGKNMSPRIDTVEKICEGLGISLAEFFSPEIDELLPLVLAEYEKMNLDEEQKNDLAYIKDKSTSEQNILLGKALMIKIKSLPQDTQKAFFVILNSLFSARL